MAQPTTTAAAPRPESTVTERRREIPRAGWMVIAGKEFGDHLLSSRFYVLAIIMALAAAVPLYFLSGQIREAPTGANDYPALFIALFGLTPSANDQISLPSVVGFLALVGPLLGLAFSFDAINGERANGTLPRLLSQPIHRDAVINGKFAAGLAVIALVLVVMVLGVAAFALIRLGIVPELVEVLRIVLWVLVTLTYIAVWLAFGMLLSVGIRRAATSALVGFGIWLFVAVPIFGPFLVGLLGGLLAGGSSSIGEYLGTTETVQRILPGTLYQEASAAMLSPGVTSVSLSDFYSASALPSRGTLLTVDQSLILVWPHLVVLFALTIGCFALAYARFMRQEVRA